MMVITNDFAAELGSIQFVQVGESFGKVAIRLTPWFTLFGQPRVEVLEVSAETAKRVKDAWTEYKAKEAEQAAIEDAEPVRRTLKQKTARKGARK